MFFEIYFPQHAAYQGEIFNSLLDGYKESEVKKYLKENASALLKELGTYRRFLDTTYYKNVARKKNQISIEEAYERINMYTNYFYGWSMYTVNGVFFGEDDKMYEENTQVVRLMFKITSSV
jgi:hypothetical protein